MRPCAMSPAATRRTPPNFPRSPAPTSARSSSTSSPRLLPTPPSKRSSPRAPAAEYEAGPYKGFSEQVQEAFAAIVPDDADAGGVADLIVNVVDTPFGKRPFRVHYDPTQDGADVGFTVLDRLRAEMLHRVGLSDLLKPSVFV